MTTEAGPEDQMRQVTAVCRKPVKAVLSASSTVRGDVWASTRIDDAVKVAASVVFFVHAAKYAKSPRNGLLNLRGDLCVLGGSLFALEWAARSAVRRG